MRLIDLTRTLDAADLDRLPAPVRPSASVLVPTVEHIDPRAGGAEVMAAVFGCSRDDLPDGEGWGDEHLEMSSHLGTHVDAPLHYGSTCEGRPARTVDQLTLDELVCDAVVLDLRGTTGPGEGITVATLERALEANGGEVTEGAAVLLRTGMEDHDLADPALVRVPGHDP